MHACTMSQEGSLELFMESMGLAQQQIDAAVQMATQWRVTEGGRPLLDRRRRSRVQRNVDSITNHLLSVCGLTFGAAAGHISLLA